MKIEQTDSLQTLRWSRGLGAVTLALGLLLVLMMKAQAAPVTSPNPPAPGQLQLEETVSAGPGPVQAGERFTYTIRLRHVSGAGPAQSVLTDTLPAQVRLAGPIQAKEEKSGDGPLAVNMEGRTLRWRGALGPDGVLRIEIPVQARACYIGETEKAVNRVTARQSDGSELAAEAEVSIQCFGGSVDDVAVERSIVEPEDALPLGGGPAMILDAATPLLLQTRLTNNGDEPVILGLNMEQTRWRLAGESPDTNAARTRLMAFERVTLQAGETKTLQHRWYVPELDSDVSAATGGPNFDAEYEAVSGLAYCLLEPDETECPDPEQHQARVRKAAELRFRWMRSDLGDAPDSSNHAAAGMTAYAGIPAGVPAAFPTVHDPTLPGAPGPRHLHTPLFHLGPLVSTEGEADLGPDQDAINNIEPATDSADLDRFDDGAAPSLWALQDCQTAAVPVKVSILPAAVTFFQNRQDKNGYLNIWLDGNRDGDWDDATVCSTEPATTSLEHVVIDFPVDVTALGVGLHTINVPTGLVSWPADQAEKPAWVRVTLSERPANKTLGGGTYGDGRGYDKAFVLGETEDYLWRPGDQPAGADLVIRKQGRIRQEYDPETGAVATRIVWAIEYANVGDLPVQNAVVRDRLEDGLDITQNVLDVQTSPEVPYAADGSDLVFNVGLVEPGARGFILVITDVTDPMVELETVQNYARIDGDGDVNPDNNEAVAAVSLTLHPPRILSPIDGTTCSTEVEIVGRVRAHAEVEIFVDGVSVASGIKTGAQGLWRHTLTLDPGGHVIEATATLGGVTSPPSKAINLLVDPILAWSPISLTFTDPHGRTLQPVDEEGRLDADGWSLRLRPNTTYSVSVFLCCTAPDAAVSLTVEGVGDVLLSDADGDQVYEGSFTTGERQTTVKDISITTVCAGVTASNSGSAAINLIDPEGEVYDLATQQRLAEATVACLEQQTGPGPNGGGFALWDAAAYNQVNPQVTKDDGYFSFLTPPGSYRLQVNRQGYQPYRSPTLEVVQDPVRFDVGLTAKLAGPAQHTVRMTANGFDPALLRIRAGERVRFLNVDGGEHTATRAGMTASAAKAGGLWDSGLLASGESYVVQLSAAGEYEYADVANPANTGLIVVEGGPAGENALFLPSVNASSD